MGASFAVSVEEAQKFQNIWTKNGLAIPMPPEAAHFAKDFANIVLKNFIDMCQKQSQEAAKLQHPKQLIIEGVQ
jgi:hypothetical protein